MNEAIIYAAGGIDVRLKRTAYKGSERIDLRIWCDIEGERRPTRKGVSVPLEHVPVLIDALRAMLAGGAHE